MQSDSPTRGRIVGEFQPTVFNRHWIALLRADLGSDSQEQSYVRKHHHRAVALNVAPGLEKSRK